MSKWKLVKVDDIKADEKRSIISGPFGSNISRKFFVEDGVPVIRGNNLSLDLGNKLIDNGFVYITKQKADELNTWAIEEDLVFTAAGTIGQVGLIKDSKYGKYIISNKQLRLRVNKNKILPLYAYYWLSSPLMIRKIKSLNTGSTIPLINLSVLKSLEIPLPPLPTQCRIVTILSSLDDKIENNRKTCEKLEEIAQTIFKRWFVEFEFPNEEDKPYKSSGGELVYSEELGKKIPKGWRVGKLNEIVDNIKDSCKQKDIIGMPYLPIDIIPKIQLGLEGYDTWENAKSSLVKFNRNDIILGAMRVYFHRVIISPFNGVTRTTCMILRPKERFDREYALLNINQDTLIDWASINSKGSTMPYAFWNKGLEAYKIIIPSREIRIKFNNLISSTINIIQDNYRMLMVLQQTRDTLLPKLMSGKIDLEGEG